MRLCTFFLCLSVNVFVLANENNNTVEAIYFTDQLINGAAGPEMVWIPAGDFIMGDIQGIGLNDEVPPHKVSINKRFALGKYPVTFLEYDLFCEKTNRTKAYDHGWGRGERPVIHVNWLDAIAYTKWLSQQTGKKYRLPTEAEWEYAVRAGSKTNYWWGNKMLPDMAYCFKCGDNVKKNQTTVVGRFSANPFGLYDVVGNVWEWTASKWTKTYFGDEVKQIDENEVVISPNYLKAAQLAMRGGAWNLHERFNRSSSRYYGAPKANNMNLGFRVARSE